ncbi:5-(carboxyamino)imidazole ribonucleotide synthase [Notoacmeibacter sp. MSK16QG-6]|uniref:5-(carboxyamino)imidazole ribonucleotide synthase n=1 Tax=Notoacmeibacter sp. MSK16QG-6 TaxID=2957982 RepID=UPI00209DF0D7|nr:5-(carboxyamino)imidazole ribonucleotide synthase [Notoacmeibacter sp. MSK16QG-6]MCP1198821.1 5-(carboxyamino)imidazole ribonucleotide synthase [Notoacmeibacter sp. MSK16QG-6]
MTDTPLSPGSTIGIIGGGQLGRMLTMAAARLGYGCIVLEKGGCPARDVCVDHIDAAYDDADALAMLAEKADVVTYEFENVPIETVERLTGSVPVYPPAKALSCSQDRLAEKRFINETGIGTAPFLAVNNDADIADALKQFGGKGVLKTRRMGYDGKGQHVFNGDAPAEETAIFDEMGGVPLIMEGFIDFACEISIIAARGQDGQIALYDPARNEHSEGILRRSTVPCGAASSIEAKARDAARLIVDALDYVGVLGIEFFVTGNDELLVNEIAPRVHNSGHWTEAACAINQFEQHIRAIVGLPLGSTARHSDCVMENLIGDEIAALPAIAQKADAVVHHYGKRQARPRRKMGHVTYLSARSGS